MMVWLTNLAISLSLLCGGLIAASPASAGNDFPLSLGTYLDTEPAEPVGLAYAADGSLIVALNRGLNAIPFGEIRRVDPASGNTLEVLYSGSVLIDFRGGSGTTRWAGITPAERLLSAPNGRSLASTDSLPIGASGRGIAVCPNHVAVLTLESGDYVARVYATDGTLVRAETSGATEVADVACDPVSQRLFITGYDQVSTVLQMPFVEGIPFGTGTGWRAWGFSNSEANSAGVSSDARGVVLRRSATGELWVGGRADGGVSAFGRNPQNINLSAANVAFDEYNNPFNTGGVSITYFARLDPTDGTFQIGQYLLARLSSNAGNSVFISDLDVDGAGRLHVAGRSSASMANRDNLTVAGQAVATYAGGDPSLLVAASGLGSRDFWTTFIDTGGRGEVLDVATLDDRYALMAINNAGSLLTVKPLIDANDLTGTPDGSNPYAWLGTWGNTETIDLVFSDSFEL